MDEKHTLIERLLEEITQLKRIIAEQALTIEMQGKRIAELEKRLGKNSGNSSKPPASDGLSKKSRTNSLRLSGQKPSGGQQGHKGNTLEQRAQPDKIQRHALTACPKCANSLSDEPVVGVIKRQVFDIPQPVLEVTEHQAEIKTCLCCKKRVTASFPEGINAPTQYGATLQSWGVYLQHEQLMPEERLQETFSDLLRVNISTATINRWSEIVYEKLETTETDILTKIKNSPVKHADESGCRVMAQTQWLHSASTEKLTYYTLSAQRKTPFIDFIGIMVHDHWKNYFKIMGVLHALCNQHHLRELQSLIENEKELWAKNMQRCLRLGLQYRHKYGAEPIPEEIQERYLNLYNSIVDKGIAFHESQPAFSTQKKRGRQAKRTGHNLLLRLKNYRDDVLRFFTNPEVPFTNNQAERDIRMIKCKQKISGGFRSLLGAKIFLRIRGFISTVRKHGLSIFQAIQNTLQGLTPIIL